LNQQDKKPSDGLNISKINELLSFKELDSQNTDLPDLNEEEVFLVNYKIITVPEREKNK
jgi:hypothetical protein